jgi:hypothetical protein
LRKNLVVAKQKTTKVKHLVIMITGVIAFVASACATDATPFVEPTQRLIPPTATYTPSPLPPTTAQPTQPAPGDLVGTAVDVQPTVSDEDNLLEVDPVASELATLAQRRIAEELGLPTRRVRILEVVSYVWPDTSLGCPIPGETYTQQTVDGYRIVLAAGDNEYIFHTDFDRAVPCDPANEQLPVHTDN